MVEEPKEENSRKIKANEAIVDLCYNYVGRGIAFIMKKRYADEEFLSDFQKRLLYEFWKEYREGKHEMNGEYPLKQKNNTKIKLECC